MKLKIISVLSLLALSACYPPPTEKTGKSNMATNEPVQIAEVDGVKLWKVKDDTSGGAYYVYFTSRGSTYSENSCGKNCTARTHVSGLPD